MKFELLQSWRDARASWGKLVLFGSAIVCGIAVITFASLLTTAIRNTLDLQARAILGGDIELSAKSPIPVPPSLPDGANSAEEVSFRSMASFSRSGAELGSRLVVLRALEPELPFYGRIETQPDTAWAEVIRRSGDGALVDESLLVQLDGKIGDSVEVAGRRFTVRGTVTRSIGQAGIVSVFAPRIYIARASLPPEFLEQKGSVADFTRLIKLPNGVDATEYSRTIRADSTNNNVQLRTVADSRARLERITNNTGTFLYLVAFTALVLGAAAAGASFYVYVKGKRQTIAVLKCLGGTAQSIQLIFCLQALAVGVVTALLGVALGTLLYSLLPDLLQRFIPLPIESAIHWQALMPALIAGIGTLLFAAAPSLYQTSRVSPLLVLRDDETQERLPWWLVLAGTLEAVAFSTILAPSATTGLAVAGGTAIAAVLLAVLALLLRAGARRLAAFTTSFAYRQGAAALYRPNNQTVLIFIIFGLTCALTGLALIARHLLLSQSEALDSAQKANVYVFDISPEQKQDIEKVFSSLGLQVIQDAPIVLTRITSIKGVPASQLLESPGKSTVPPWALRREFWSTYRDWISPNEQVVAGTWTPRLADQRSLIPISVDDGLAKQLGVTVGDPITFGIQGVELTSVVGSLRDIQWEKLERNSLIVFPTGVLEDAPQFRFLSTHAPNVATLAQLQREIIQKFPNVSVIDISSIVRSVQEILSGIERAAAVLGLLLLLIAISVLASTIISTYGARIREVGLLRALGASSRTIRRCIQAEYLLLFTVSAAAGTVVSLAGGYALARFLFNVQATYPWGGLGITFAVLIITAVITATLVTSPVLRHPSLLAIRND